MTSENYVDFAPGTVTLGWRFDEVLPRVAADAIDEYYNEYAGGYDYRSGFFSPLRTVFIQPFSLAADAVPWTDLIESPHEVESAHSLNDICLRINDQLHFRGLRLPTEDELEAAIGGGLFSWGNVVPDGIPYGSRTSFTKHKEPTTAGLRLNSNTYSTELVQGYFKLGDGGFSVCGGEPWPLPWLSLCPAYRVPSELYGNCLPEYLESTLIRPVKGG